MLLACLSKVLRTMIAFMNRTELFLGLLHAFVPPLSPSLKILGTANYLYDTLFYTYILITILQYLLNFFVRNRDNAKVVLIGQDNHYKIVISNASIKIIEKLLKIRKSSLLYI